MKRPRQMNLHAGLSPKFSIKKAHAMQLHLSKRVIHKNLLPRSIRHVGGVDVAYARGVSIGAAVVFDFDSLTPVESKTVSVETRFPYIPTLLSFREIRPAFLAVRRLAVEPEVILVDGQGYAHPYRLGFAAHLGIVLDMPTIGVAKSLLCGETKTPRIEEWKPLVDAGEIVGAAVVTKRGKKPVYVSVGHKVSLKRAVKVVLQCIRGHRIPEPARKAHIVATEEKEKSVQHK